MIEEWDGENFTSWWNIGRICDDRWLLSFGLKSCKDKDDQNEEWHYVQEGKGFDLNK
jgi:hypothetical protein